MEEYHGQYVLVTEGATPTKDGGVYCMIGNKPHMEHVAEAAEGAAAIVAIGSCASWGGIQAADPNPTGARPTKAIVPDKTVVNIPGCPPNPYNFLSTVLYLLTFGKPPELDEENRPKFAYGRLVHENCERRPHFDAGRFALEFGDYGHRQGFCLYKLGCKGPETYANCPVIEFGDVGGGAWPVGVGGPCFGCTEKGVGFTKPLHEQAEVITLLWLHDGGDRVQKAVALAGRSTDLYPAHGVPGGIERQGRRHLSGRGGGGRRRGRRRGRRHGGGHEQDAGSRHRFRAGKQRHLGELPS